VRYIFGNPGHYQGCRSLMPGGRPADRVHPRLQEVPVMGMADGYAMAFAAAWRGEPAHQLRLGNAMGMLYNAPRRGTPLLVTASIPPPSGLREPILASDM